jgi:hypothetical protein
MTSSAIVPEYDPVEFRAARADQAESDWLIDEVT